MASTHTNSRRLIEDWFPINEISIEAIRERAAASALPPLNWLHVWWARRPLATSRAAAAASLLSGPPASSEFYGLLGTHPGIVDEQQNLDEAKIQGLRLKQGFSKPRAFTHNLSETEREWLHQNLVTDNPVVLDITAGRRVHTFRGRPPRVQNHRQRAEPRSRPDTPGNLRMAPEVRLGTAGTFPGSQGPVLGQSP